MKPYLIQNSQGEFWSNSDGWVVPANATNFSKKEKDEFNLPVDGRWVTYWEVDLVQFARLISECAATGMFDGEEIEEVADTMNLELSDVYEIISRAQKVFESVL